MGCSVHSTGELTYWPTDSTMIKYLLDFAKMVKMVKILFKSSYIGTSSAVKLIRRNTNISNYKSWLKEKIDS